MEVFSDDCNERRTHTNVTLAFDLLLIISQLSSLPHKLQVLQSLSIQRLRKVTYDSSYDCQDSWTRSNRQVSAT